MHIACFSTDARSVACFRMQSYNFFWQSFSKNVRKFATTRSACYVGRYISLSMYIHLHSHILYIEFMFANWLCSDCSYFCVWPYSVNNLLGVLWFRYIKLSWKSSKNLKQCFTWWRNECDCSPVPIPQLAFDILVIVLPRTRMCDGTRNPIHVSRSHLFFLARSLE
jgi:hypothetical protein